MAKGDARSIDEICSELDELVQQPGYIYALAAMLRHDLFLNPAEAADINWRERLSYQEFTFLTGLLIKYPLNLTSPKDSQQSKLIKRTYELFRELQASHLSHWFEKLAEELEGGKPTPEDYKERTRRLFGAGGSMSEPIFYSGSGAYDFQYWELAPERYALDREWLARNKRIDMEKAAKIVENIKHAKGAFFEKRPRDSAGRNEQMLDLFCVSANDLKDHDPADVSAVFEAFSTGFGEANQDLKIPGQYNVLNSHPLIKLADDKYFIPVQFNLAQSLYESPYYWFIRDPSYKDQSLKNRGAAAENIAGRILNEVFGAEKVFKNVLIYKGKKVVAEIDVLALYGNRAVIVQSKSKRLTELSRTGDTASLESDFKKAIQQGYEQGLNCRSALLAPAGLTFTANGKPVSIPKLKDAYIMCLVSDHYPALTHQSHIYLDKAEEAPYPVALSVFDLDIMAFYLRNPFEFLYYLRQRVDTADYFHATEEVALLAYHLRTKLYRNPEADRVSIDDSMAQLIDANFPVAKGQMPKTAAADRLFHDWKNEEFDKLVTAIQRATSAEYVDAVFLLYDVAGESADRLMEGMRLIKSRSLKDGQKHSLAIQSTDNSTGISYVVTPNPARLQDETLIFGSAKKYRTKSKAWLALGSVTRSSSLVDSVAFNDDPWQQDEDMESVASMALKTGTAVGPLPKIGRNAPCPCGSGKKFKKCHGSVAQP